MSNEHESKTGRSAAQIWAIGGAWMLVFLGVGGCCYLGELSGSEKPFVSIQNGAGE